MTSSELNQILTSFHPMLKQMQTGLNNLVSQIETITGAGEKRSADSDIETIAPTSTKKIKRARTPKDPNAPKRPMTSYLRFQAENRQRIAASVPDGNYATIREKLSAEWVALTPEQKQV